MTPLEAARALNAEAKEWTLHVAAATSVLHYYVAGNVFPLGKRRGQRAFFGGHDTSAERALQHGIEALRERRAQPR